MEGGDVAFNASPDAYSGYVRYFRDSIMWLQRSDVAVTFGAVRGRSPLHPVMEEMGCPTFALGCGSAATYAKGARTLSRIVEQSDVDLLHLHEPISGTVGGAAARLSRRPSIFHRHHVVVQGPMRILSFTASRLTRHVIAVSHHAAGYARLHDLVSPRKLTVAHNGIEPPRAVTQEEVQVLKKSLAIPDSAHVLLTLGHLRPEKGYDVMLRSLPHVVAKAQSEIHYVVVGAGPEETSLRALATSQSLSSVHFCGHQPDVWPWLKMADVVVVPSYRESFGLVAIEAMAIETAVVAARSEGLREVVEHEKTGLLFEAGDVLSLAEALTLMLHEDSTRKHLAASGRRRYVERFTTRAMVEGWIGVYEKILQT